MLRSPRAGSRGELLAGGLLAFSILVVIIAGFSMGLEYLELEPGSAIGIQSRLMLAGAILLLICATVLNLFMRRR
jgi:hypothetical protein